MSAPQNRTLRRAYASLSRTAKRILPPELVTDLERRRALRRQLREWAAAHEGQVGKLERRDLEERIAGRSEVYDRLLKDALEWNELMLQELGRKIERVTVRHDDQLRSIQEELHELRALLEAESDGRERLEG